MVNNMFHGKCVQMENFKYGQQYVPYKKIYKMENFNDGQQYVP